MTILDEESHGLGKYHYLHFIEFLDMFARISLNSVLNKPDLRLDRKAQWLLEIVYNNLREFAPELKIIPCEEKLGS